MQVTIAKLDKPKYRSTPRTKSQLIAGHANDEIKYRLKQKIKRLLPVRDNLEAADYHHSNYMEYLETAWANHYGVVFTPDIMWYTLIGELVQIVADEPKKYAELFTTTPDQKQDIIIRSGDLEVMPINDLMEAIKRVVPTKTEVFLPEFSTTTERSRQAVYASFADIVSPYYNYSMFCCGIPYVDVRGTQDDWQKIVDNWEAVAKLVPGHDDFFANSLNTLKEIVNQFDGPDPEFWKKMFYLKECGSGSQTELFGWFTEFFRKQPRPRFSENFSTHIAKVCYKQLNTNLEYEMYQGLFTSKLNGDLLEPEFGYIVYNRPEKPVVEDYDPYNVETVTVGAAAQ